MADNSANIYPYPLMFDPSQFSNKYSQFNTGTQMPGWPTQYAGVPTDALGRPIQSYLDAQNAAANQPKMAPPVTLNSAPNTNQMLFDSQNQAMGMANAMAGGGPPTANTADLAQSLYQQKLSAAGLQPNRQYSAPWGSGTIPGNMGNSTDAQGNRTFGPGAGGQSGQQPAGAGGGGIDMSAAYLAALQNPGHVTTPGATVPQAPTPSSQSGVLDQFLANWNQKGSPTIGAGNYNNAGFFNALRGQV